MAEEIPEEYSSNYETFRDILSSVLIESITAPSPKAKPKSKRRSKRQPTPDTTDPEDEPPSAEELTDFTTYIATTTFLTLPLELQSLTYRHWSDNPSFQETYTLPLSKDDVSALLQSLDPSISDSLTAYGIIFPEDSDDKTNTTLSKFFVPVLSSYITELTTPPPASRATRALVSGCEICGRDWVGLGYHHLIPRFVHDKAVKRGWHRPEDLQNVAWLCGACHRFVHRFADHEELARKYFTVERLLEAEEVRRFAGWVGRLRWKGGRV